MASITTRIYLLPTLRKKKPLCLHQFLRFLRATVNNTENRSEITTHIEGKIVAQKLYWS